MYIVHTLKQQQKISKCHESIIRSEVVIGCCGFVATFVLFVRVRGQLLVFYLLKLNVIVIVT